MLAEKPVSERFAPTSETLSLIGSEEWDVYARVFAELQREGINFAIGGGFAKQCYTGIPRQAKDLDLYILPCHRDTAVRVTSRAGLADYYERRPYDRAWIYRSFRADVIHEDVIVDVIWAMANQRAQVDGAWINSGPLITVRDITLRLVPPEELIWSALYVLQRDRSDWPDALNLLHACAAHLNWDHLIERLGEDLPLLAALAQVFLWLCPDRVCEIPPELRSRIAVADKSQPNCGLRGLRAARLDTRPWFALVGEQERRDRQEGG